MKGIEPSSKAWEAFVLPLNYTRTTQILPVAWSPVLAILLQVFLVSANSILAVYRCRRPWADLYERKWLIGRMSARLPQNPDPVAGVDFVYAVLAEGMVFGERWQGP